MNLFDVMLARPDVAAQHLMGAYASSEAGQNPSLEDRFLRASMLAGKPITSIPRQGGLIAQGLQKLGVLSPTIEAPPDVQAESQGLVDYLDRARKAQQWSQLVDTTKMAADIGGPQTIALLQSQGIDLPPGFSATLQGMQPRGVAEQEFQTKQLAAQQQHYTEEAGIERQRLDIDKAQYDYMKAVAEGKTGREPMDEIVSKALVTPLTPEQLPMDPDLGPLYFTYRAKGMKGPEALFRAQADIRAKKANVPPEESFGTKLGRFFGVGRGARPMSEKEKSYYGKKP